jgi:hypothetical protein
VTDWREDKSLTIDEVCDIMDDIPDSPYGIVVSPSIDKNFDLILDADDVSKNNADVGSSIGYKDNILGLEYGINDTLPKRNFIVCESREHFEFTINADFSKVTMSDSLRTIDNNDEFDDNKHEKESFNEGEIDIVKLIAQKFEEWGLIEYE